LDNYNIHDNIPELTKEDEELLGELDDITKDITEHIEKFRLDLSGDKIYHYIWHRFADKILEESKPILTDGTDAEKLSRQHTLYTILTTTLKLLHPFMPFVTEEIWQSLPEQYGEKMLMVAAWPVVK
jgi:valyl-tRNA synthetase